MSEARAAPEMTPEEFDRLQYAVDYYLGFYGLKDAHAQFSEICGLVTYKMGEQPGMNLDVEAFLGRESAPGQEVPATKRMQPQPGEWKATDPSNVSGEEERTWPCALCHQPSKVIGNIIQRHFTEDFTICPRSGYRLNDDRVSVPSQAGPGQFEIVTLADSERIENVEARGLVQLIMQLGIRYHQNPGGADTFSYVGGAWRAEQTPALAEWWTLHWQPCAANMPKREPTPSEQIAALLAAPITPTTMLEDLKVIREILRSAVAAGVSMNPLGHHLNHLQEGLNRLDKATKRVEGSWNATQEQVDKEPLPWRPIRMEDLPDEAQNALADQRDMQTALERRVAKLEALVAPYSRRLKRAVNAALDLNQAQSKQRRGR